MEKHRVVYMLFTNILQILSLKKFLSNGIIQKNVHFIFIYFFVTVDRGRESRGARLMLRERKREKFFLLRRSKTHLPRCKKCKLPPLLHMLAFRILKKKRK